MSLKRARAGNLLTLMSSTHYCTTFPRDGAPVVLDLVEEPHDAVARSVEVLAEADWVFAIGFGRNVRLGVSARDHLAQRDEIVTLVGKKQGALGQVGDHLRRAGDVGVLASCQLELDRVTLLVDDRMDFGREAASGAAQTTISPPLFAVAPCW